MSAKDSPFGPVRAGLVHRNTDDGNSQDVIVDRLTRERDAAARVACRALLAGNMVEAVEYAKMFARDEKKLERTMKRNG